MNKKSNQLRADVDKKRLKTDKFLDTVLHLDEVCQLSCAQRFSQIGFAVLISHKKYKA